MSVTEGPVPQRDRQWELALLPAVPLALLVGRIWLWSRRDPQTMLLLVANLSPAGLIVTVVMSVAALLPIILLVGRMLNDYRLVSLPPDRTQADPWLLRLGRRFPNWLVGAAACFATVTWEVQYLPALAAIVIVIVALGVRLAYPGRRRLVVVTAIGLPALAALVQFVVLGPAIGAAVSDGLAVTALLLVLPPLLTLLLTGPLPAFAAQPATLLPALTVCALVPLLITTTYLRAPLLPLVAVEVTTGAADEPFPPVLVGHMITVQDHVATLIDLGGRVRFIRTDRIAGQKLCPPRSADPESDVAVGGWPVNRSLLDQLMPGPVEEEPDRRCQGRIRPGS